MVLLNYSFESAIADLVVVTNQNNSIQELSREQVVYLFTGREQNFPNGNLAFPIDHIVDSTLRSDFYLLLLGKTVAQVNAYWARLMFTGNATPPKVLPSVEAVQNEVRENLYAISYLDESSVDNRLKVVYRLK